MSVSVVFVFLSGVSVSVTQVLVLVFFLSGVSASVTQVQWQSNRSHTTATLLPNFLPSGRPDLYFS